MVEANPKPGGQYSKAEGWVERTKPITPIVSMGFALRLSPSEPRSPGLYANANGFGDWPFLLMKYRILSASEQIGN
jgi:hypothetical protein